MRTEIECWRIGVCYPTHQMVRLLWRLRIWLYGCMQGAHLSCCSGTVASREQKAESILWSYSGCRTRVLQTFVSACCPSAISPSRFTIIIVIIIILTQSCSSASLRRLDASSSCDGSGSASLRRGSPNRCRAEIRHDTLRTAFVPPLQRYNRCKRAPQTGLQRWKWETSTS